MLRQPNYLGQAYSSRGSVGNFDSNFSFTVVSPHSEENQGRLSSFTEKMIENKPDVDEQFKFMNEKIKHIEIGLVAKITDLERRLIYAEAKNVDQERKISDLSARIQMLERKEYVDENIKENNSSKIILKETRDDDINFGTALLGDKHLNKILGSLPDKNTTNPIAALINYCKHQLMFDVDFRSYETAGGMHHVQLYFRNVLVCEAADRKKKAAKELCAKAGLKKINEDKDYLLTLIQIAMKN